MRHARSNTRCLRTISTPIRNSRMEFDRSEISFDKYLLNNLKNLKEKENET